MWRNTPSNAFAPSNAPETRQTMVTQDYAYFGGLFRGFKSGFGTIIFNDNSVYSGSFHEDQFSGNGTFIYANGAVLSGAFSRGELVQGTVTFQGQTNEIKGGIWRHMFGQVVADAPRQPQVAPSQVPPQPRYDGAFKQEVLTTMKHLAHTTQTVQLDVTRMQGELSKQSQRQEATSQVVQELRKQMISFKNSVEDPFFQPPLVTDYPPVPPQNRPPPPPAPNQFTTVSVSTPFTKAVIQKLADKIKDKFPEDKMNVLANKILLLIPSQKAEEVVNKLLKIKVEGKPLQVSTSAVPVQNAALNVEKSSPLNIEEVLVEQQVIKEQQMKVVVDNQLFAAVYIQCDETEFFKLMKELGLNKYEQIEIQQKQTYIIPLEEAELSQLKNNQYKLDGIQHQIVINDQMQKNSEPTEIAANNETNNEIFDKCAHNQCTEECQEKFVQIYVNVSAFTQKAADKIVATLQGSLSEQETAQIQGKQIVLTVKESNAQKVQKRIVKIKVNEQTLTFTTEIKSAEEKEMKPAKEEYAFEYITVHLEEFPAGTAQKLLQFVKSKLPDVNSEIVNADIIIQSPKFKTAEIIATLKLMAINKQKPQITVSTSEQIPEANTFEPKQEQTAQNNSQSEQIPESEQKSENTFDPDPQSRNQTEKIPESISELQNQSNPFEADQTQIVTENNLFGALFVQSTEEELITLMQKLNLEFYNQIKLNYTEMFIVPLEKGVNLAAINENAHDIQYQLIVNSQFKE
ncbi:Conserved_hypothetical protein [Hexamita inflata]|uniref:Uncharacterized protein n=1 Tax=Hexamita inflata TaxID=28002 RepID=A0AA86U0Q3_9EUKA|nr:Conserved hypothetical protein [Hexamita inflata]